MNNQFDSNKGQNRQLLHYGCLVYLTYKDDQGQEFFVTADGYTKNKIQLKSKEDILKVSSISASLFKIYPTFYNNEYVKTRKKYDEKRSQKKFTTVERREARAEIPKQIKAMEEETALNYEQYEKFKGSPVIFGQTIQLLHFNSNKYLFYDLNHVSEFESNNLKVGFKDEHSDETCYRILPCYTFQQEGSGNIYDQDIVNIVSTVDQLKTTGGEPYLHASKAKLVSDKSGNQKIKREVNISTERKTPWMMHIFSEFIDERDGFLSVQDCVWINFSEQDLNLIVQRDQTNQFKQLKEGQKQQESKEKDKIIFEGCTSSANYNKFIGNSNGMFTVESQSITQGGLVRWSSKQSPTPQQYRLRHLTSKKYLKIPNAQLDQENLIETVSDYQSASLFSFELIYSTLTSFNRLKAKEFLQKDSYFRLSTFVEAPTTQIYLQDTPSNQDKILTEVWMKTSKNLLPHLLYIDETIDVLYPAFNETKKEEFVFKLAKANFNEVRMTNFLLACLKTLRGSEQYLNQTFLNTSTMNDEKFQLRYKNFLTFMTRLEKCLVDLDLFCHNQLIAYLYIDQDYGHTNSFIQNVLREQSFIEMLVRMLCIAFPDNANLLQLKEIEQLESNQPNNSVSRVQSQIVQEGNNKNQAIQQLIQKEFFNRKKKVCRLIYKLLGGICKKNKVNQEKASVFIPIFALQSTFINQALDCIIEIIKENEQLLTSVHSQVNDNSEQIKNTRTKSLALSKKTSTTQARNNVHQQTMRVPMKAEEYVKQYDRICNQIYEGNFISRIKWDLLQFFSIQLKDKDQSSTASKKRDLISFLEFASTFEGKGVNINQERIYQYLLTDNTFEQLFLQEVFIKIQTDGNRIKIFYKGEERIFLEFFSKDKKPRMDNQNQGQLQEQELGQSKYLSTFLKKQAIITPSSQTPSETVLNLIQDQIGFYSSMCNSRNNTWKKSLESFFPGAVLVINLTDPLIGYNMRAIICKLLNKLYVDQEPRRVQNFPELCKILDTNSIEGQKKGNHIHSHSAEQDALDNYDEIDLETIKNQLFNYIKQQSDLAGKLSLSIQLDDTDQKNNLTIISKESPKIYNSLTLEIIKLQKLLVYFGKYKIKLGQHDEEKKIINSEYFSLIQSLFVILEFDPTYPEARKVLLDKRDVAKKDAPAKLLGNVKGICSKAFKIFNPFELIDDDQKENKKNKLSSVDGEEGMNMNESFLKQSNVLKKILSKFLQEGKDMDLLIKLEICDILDLYLDQKMDFCLDIFKNKFQEYVKNLGLMKKIDSGEYDLEQDKKSIHGEFQKVMKECIDAFIPPILKTGTSADKDPRLNKSSGYNLDGTKTEGTSQDILDIDINQILGFEIFPSLITLFCMTQSLNMETKILNILTRFYNQRLEFAELTTKMLVLFDDVNIKIFGILNKKIRRLGKNIDESDSWLNNLSTPENQATLEQTTQFFQYFNQLLYSGSSLDSKEEVICIQEELVDGVRQDMMRNLDVYKLGIRLIKDKIDLVEGLEDSKSSTNLKNLFITCFTFLKNFVLNNITNQLVLSEYLDKFLVHIETDLGQVYLINEILRDNKKICLEKTYMLIDEFIKLIKINGRQAKYLEIFMIVQKVRKEYIQSNQKAVLNIFLDPGNKQHIFALSERVQVPHHHDTKVIPLQVKFEFNFEPEPVDKKPNYKPPGYQDEPFIYQAKLLEVLFNCAIGKEGMLQNETRLRGIISIKYALEVLSAPDSFTQAQNPFKEKLQQQYPPSQMTLLKVPMLNYLFYTYLETEKLSEDIFRCIPDLKEYIQAEIRRFDQKPVNVSSEFIEYFFTHFMMLITNWIKLYQREYKEQNQPSSTQQQINQQIEELMGEIDKLKTYIKESQFMVALKLTSVQDSLLKFFFCEDIQAAELLQKQTKQQHEKELLEQEQVQQLKLENELKLSKKKKTLVNTLMTKRTQRVKTDKVYDDAIWKGLWNQYLECFLNSKELKDEIEAEHLIFAKALDKVEEIYAKNNMMKEHINKNQIFSKLINFLHKGSDQPGATSTIKQVLRALSNYIKISADNVDENCEIEEKENLESEEKAHHQNFLNNNNAMTIVLMLLSNNQDVERSEAIFDDLIQFGIQLLDGGNRDVQKSVYSFVMNYTTSEVFFMRLHEKFDQEVLEIQKEEEDGTIVVYGFQKQPDAIQNTLRLMQLFGEGHYAELQNYIRFQQMNYHSYDLFTDTVELLQAYFAIKKQKYFETMIQCFDTITEFVQGPCVDNQIALFQADFLDTASNLLAVDEIMDDLERNIFKGFKKDKLDDMYMFEDSQVQEHKAQERFPRWMQSRLKYKCSVTLLSLLEARTSNEIVIRLIKSLNIEMLKRNMVDTFHIFQVMYKEDYCDEIFLHFNKDPSPEDDEKEVDFSSFIIETGFNLYVLYQIFIEVKESSGDDNQVKIKEDQEEVLQRFLQNSILGKIMSLFIALLKGITDKLVDIKNQAKDLISGKNEMGKNYELMKQQLKDRRSKLFKKSMKFFSTHSVHIEVLREDKQIEKTYFYLPPFCFSLDKETKTKFNQGASRISVKAKVTSLQQASDELIKNMKLNYQLNLYLSKVKILAVLVANIGLLRDIAFILALIINFMVLLSFKRVPDADSVRIDDIIITLGTIVIVFSTLIVAYFLAKTAPLIIKAQWVGVKKDNFNIMKLIIRTLKTIYYLVSDFYILYYIIYGFTAIIGTIVSPFFFAFHLFDVLVRFPVLANVVKAVWLPKKSILFTLLLFVVLMYVFTLFAYYFLSESYTKGYCESTWQCLLTAIDRSFKYDGGLGGFLTPSTQVEGRQQDVSYFMIRFFFDNIYFILLMIIMINIVAGIIIDTFGTLREELNKYTFDLGNFCFICGFDKEKIEKSSRRLRGFEFHISDDHYMWNYLFYIAYIQNKDSTEYTGIESYVAQKVEEDDQSWFPTFKALCIDDSEDQDSQGVLQQLGKIKEDQHQLQEILDTINEQLTKIEQENDIDIS